MLLNEICNLEGAAWTHIYTHRGKIFDLNLSVKSLNICLS